MTFLSLLTYIFYFSIKFANFWYTACPIDYRKKKLARWYETRLKSRRIAPPSPQKVKIGCKRARWAHTLVDWEILQFKVFINKRCLCFCSLISGFLRNNKSNICLICFIKLSLLELLGFHTHGNGS